MPSPYFTWLAIHSFIHSFNKTAGLSAAKWPQSRAQAQDLGHRGGVSEACCWTILLKAPTHTCTGQSEVQAGPHSGFPGPRKHPWLSTLRAQQSRTGASTRTLAGSPAPVRCRDSFSTSWLCLLLSLALEAAWSPFDPHSPTASRRREWGRFNAEAAPWPGKAIRGATRPFSAHPGCMGMGWRGLLCTSASSLSVATVSCPSYTPATLIRTGLEGPSPSLARSKCCLQALLPWVRIRQIG